MRLLQWVVDQWDVLVRGVRTLAKMAELRRREDEFLADFEKRKAEKLEPALRALASAFARREGLPVDSVQVILNKDGALVAVLKSGETRHIGYVNEARPN